MSMHWANGLSKLFGEVWEPLYIFDSCTLVINLIDLAMISSIAQCHNILQHLDMRGVSSLDAILQLELLHHSHYQHAQLPGLASGNAPQGSQVTSEHFTDSRMKRWM